MKYQLFTYVDADGVPAPGLWLDDKPYALRSVLRGQGMRWQSVDDMLTDWAQADDLLQALADSWAAQPQQAQAHALPQKVCYLPPLTRCGVIYAAGANYHDHVQAMARALNMALNVDPKKDGLPPWHFLKAGQATLTGHQADVPFPAHTEKLDWEAELAVIMGKRAINVTVDAALTYVAGYSCANDLSARDNLTRPQVDASSPFRFDWLGHKCFTGSCPLGPFITPARHVASPENLGIKLWLNGELRQDSNTANHIYSVAEHISYLSQRLALMPGDVLLTGTPAGVGMETGVFLKRGDVMRVWIEELGELETRIV